MSALCLGVGTSARHIGRQDRPGRYNAAPSRSLSSLFAIRLALRARLDVVAREPTQRTEKGRTTLLPLLRIMPR